MDFITNPFDDDVMGRVVVYFRGLQNHTVNTKSTRRDVIIERIRDKIHSLLTTMLTLYIPLHTVLSGYSDTL